MIQRGARDGRKRKGAAAIMTAVLLVPVLFGFIGFAVDLGILYSVRGELKTAAGSMALAAAQQLIGTDTATAAANTAALVTVETTSGFGNRYYFHGLPIGTTTGSQVSTIADPVYYGTLASVLADPTGSAGSGSAQAKYVRISLTGQPQLLFWSFMPLLTSRNVNVLATAVAGISAPLCQACGIEPIAVAAIDPSDTTDFGFALGTKYSFGYLCTPFGGVSAPPTLAGATQNVTYLLLNRLDTNTAVFPSEDSQAFRDGAGGLPGNTNSAQACFRINNTETIWASAAVLPCSPGQVATTVSDALCGLDTRFESATQPACANVTSIDTLATAYQPDTDANDYGVYTDYTGDGRRIITIPVVDALSSTSSMTVLAFRQFLLVPTQGAFTLNPADAYGRFVAMYIGSVAPVPQGRFDGCTQTAGPGKVVLHQ